jgi:archaemetzincin
MQRLAPEVDRRFGTRSVLGTPLPVRSEWIEPERDQLRADSVLDALIEQYDMRQEGVERWMLAMTEQDLYAPDRPYVFGEATVGGCCALVSVARLELGSPRFDARVLATVTHELAHVAGLDHCSNPACVMWASGDVYDTDRKGNVLCASCTVGFQQRLVVPGA